MSDASTGGALAGLRVLELGGMGPGPFATMLLADHGADVLRVQRPGNPFPAAPGVNLLDRNKRSVTLDLKDPAALELALVCAARADVVVEGFRPGVAERIGVGPEVVTARNPEVIYARVTGWGQAGPLAETGGHDINYVAVAGALAAVGEEGGRPVPPLNLVGDFAGGGMFVAFGILAALWERQRSGRGQVVDGAMVDGVAVLMTSFFAPEMHLGPRGTNLLDGGSPAYRVYETADGRHLAVGALDPPFYRDLIEGLGLDARTLADPHDRTAWPELRAVLAEAFVGRTLDEWTAVFADLDACVTPVLDQDEAVAHPHAVARSMYAAVDGVVQPAPAPRLSRTPARLRHGPTSPAAVAADLGDWGLTAEVLAGLRTAGDRPATAR